MGFILSALRRLGRKQIDGIDVLRTSKDPFTSSHNEHRVVWGTRPVWGFPGLSRGPAQLIPESRTRDPRQLSSAGSNQAMRLDIRMRIRPQVQPWKLELVDRQQ